MATTLCPLDCPDACGLRVEVADGRLQRVDGAHSHPLTAGVVCKKVRNFADHLYSAARVTTPLVRSGPKGSGQFRAVSWDTALSHVVARLSQVRAHHGAEAILPYCYGGSNGFLTHDCVDQRFFYRLGASRLLRTLCAAPTGAAAQAMYGRMAGVALHDYVHAQCIVVWGCNPSATSIHFLPHLRAAQRQGARLVVIDPRRTPLAEQADLHLPILPGTDLPLALALLRWLFAQGKADRAFLAAHSSGAADLEQRVQPWTTERAAAACDVPVASIEQLARWYSESAPAVIRCGWGVERSRQGGAAVAAILALPAVAGKFGVRGGGYTMSNSKVWPIDTARASRATPPASRAVNMSQLGRALLELRPKLHALFVYNANPMVSTPDTARIEAGLLRDDLFTVVFDAVLTDTAKLADVVLPATTFMEHAELHRGYGAMVLQQSRPVVPALGLARPNYAVFAELCDRMGLSQPGDPRTPEELTAALLPNDAEGQRLRAELDAKGVVLPSFGATPVQMHDVQPRTADGRIHLVPAELDAELGGRLYAYQPLPRSRPLALISPARAETINSTFGQLDDALAEVQVHPDDAAPRRIVDGAKVRISDGRQTIEALAHVSKKTRPGVLVLPKGLWRQSYGGGLGVNALSPDHVADLGGGACYNDARVEVTS